MKNIWRLILKAGEAWGSENSLEWGAALAYYAVFSVAPLLIIVLSVGGVFYKGDSLAHLHLQLSRLFDKAVADAIVAAVQSVHSSRHGVAANIVGFVILLIGASTVFGQLQNSLNRIWGVQPQPGHFWKDLFKQRLVSFAMILGISFLLPVSLILGSALAAITAYMGYLLPGGAILWHLLDTGVSFAIVIVLFGGIYKIIPAVHVAWREVWPGATITAFLFVLGNAAIGLYLRRSGIGSAYGAAGTPLVLLAWFYYSSQILFFGAEFTKLYAKERRLVSPIEGVRKLQPRERKAS